VFVIFIFKSAKVMFFSICHANFSTNLLVSKMKTHIKNIYIFATYFGLILFGRFER